MKRVVWGVAAVLAALPCVPRAAVGHGPTHPIFAAEAAASAHPLEPAEREARRFLKQAAASSRFQVDAARLALAKSSNAGVRSLAATLQEQHRTAGDELLQLLHRRGLAAPMLENAQRRALTRLGRLQGRRFDREYAASVLPELRGEVAAGERAAAIVQEPAIANWIAGRLPAWRNDAQAAERLWASMPPPAKPAKVRRRGHRHH